MNVGGPSSFMRRRRLTSFPKLVKEHDVVVSDDAIIHMSDLALEYVRLHGGAPQLTDDLLTSAKKGHAQLRLLGFEQLSDDINEVTRSMAAVIAAVVAENDRLEATRKSMMIGVMSAGVLGVVFLAYLLTRL